MFEPEVFRKQMYCSEKSAYDNFVTFYPSAVIRLPGIVPLAPLVTTLVVCNKNRKSFRK